MYRMGFIIVIILAVALGLIVGTLNHTVVAVDLLWLQLNWPLGLSLLAAIVVGICLGMLLTWLFGVLPLRLKVAKSQRQLARNSAFPDEAND